MKELIKKTKKNASGEIFLITLFTILSIFLFNLVLAANPVPPNSVTVLSNETSNASTSGAIVNISGGYIATLNVSTRTQNLRWKAFVGYISGRFALDDATGSTIYDWSNTNTTGEIYATRNGTTIAWAGINCSNITTLETENINMNLTNSFDNITATFSNTSHAGFFVGSNQIFANSCRATHTYVNNATSNSFAEVALYTQGTTIFTTILENDVTGFDGNAYDFQMIVPENGAQGFSGSTAYYLYVEIT